MARVRALDLEDAPAAARDDYRRFAEMYRGFANLVPVYAHSPAGLRHIFGMSVAMREAANLPPRLVELVVVTVSRVNACPYCAAHHSALAVDAGLAPETVDRILDPAPPGLDAVDLLVRDYAVAVTERPWGMRDALFDGLRRHFSESQIVELTMRIALAGMFNRINQALEVEMEDGVMAAFEARGLDAAALGAPVGAPVGAPAEATETGAD